MSQQTNPITRNPLLQHDLFLCVLDHIVTPDADIPRFWGARPTLISLAQTCRALSEPSLDRLWCKLSSLEPLIQCYARVVNIQSANTPPSPAEWTVIQRYSHRIREFHISLVNGFSLHFLQAISSYPSLLVPNLRVLKWYPYWTGSRPLFPIVFIERLLSPSLVSLDITLVEFGDETVQSLLANYPSLCPNLRSIAFRFSGPRDVSPTTIEFVSRSIIQYEHLEHLVVSCPLNDVTLTHVVMSPRLRELSLVLRLDGSDPQRVSIPSDTTPFRNVEDLKLEIWDVRLATTLLQTQDQTFRSFALGYRSPPNPEAVLSLFTALVSSQRVHTLRSINLSPDSRAMEWQLSAQAAGLVPAVSTVHHQLSLDTFRPLFSLCYLRKLDVTLSDWFRMNDDDLVSLVRNWPSLQSLRLDCRPHVQVYPWRSGKYITFRGLVSLLECCPDLHKLHLAVDARRVVVDTRDIVCNPALLFIYLPESPISLKSLSSVKEALARHFPSVIEVNASFCPSLGGRDPEIAQYLSLWSQIDAHLEDMPPSHRRIGNATVEEFSRPFTHEL